MMVYCPATGATVPAKAWVGLYILKTSALLPTFCYLIKLIYERKRTRHSISQKTGWEKRPQNDLVCVQLDVTS